MPRGLRVLSCKMVGRSCVTSHSDSTYSFIRSILKIIQLLKGIVWQSTFGHGNTFMGRKNKMGVLKLSDTQFAAEIKFTDSSGVFSKNVCQHECLTTEMLQKSYCWKFEV